MSLYERRRRSNVLSGDGSRLPNGGNTRVGQRGSGHLAAFSVCLGGRLDKTGTHANDGPRGEAVGKPSGAGVNPTQEIWLSGSASSKNWCVQQETSLPEQKSGAP